MDNKTILEKLNDISTFSDEMSFLDDLADMLNDAAEHLEADTLRTAVTLAAYKIEHCCNRSAGIWLRAKEIREEIKRRDGDEAQPVAEQTEVTEDDLPFC